MRPTYVVVGIAVVAVVAASAALLAPPDVDAIIASKDCGRALALADGNMAGLTNEQAAAVIKLAAGCTLQGVLGGSP